MSETGSGYNTLPAKCLSLQQQTVVSQVGTDVSGELYLRKQVRKYAYLRIHITCNHRGFK